MGVLQHGFWAEWFWLPPNITWNSFEGANGAHRAAYPSDLYLSIPAGLAFILIRMFFERFIAGPFCGLIGIKNKTFTRNEPSDFCEKIYKFESKNPTPKRMAEMAHDLTWTTSRVRRWFRRQRNQDLPNLIQKGKESCWRFFIYTVLVVYGGHVLLDKEWFYAPAHCFKGYQFHELDDEIFWYYLIEMSLYISLVITQFADVKRKDFWPMLTHHIATILLVFFSYTTHFFRIGTMIMFIHDLSDPLLEIAKVFNYAKKQTTCDALFGIFALVFFVTRLYVYPAKILYSTLFDCYKFLGTFPGFYLLNGLLFTLQLLHLLWAYYVGSAAYSFIIVGKVGKDTRSEAESSSEDDERKQVKNNHVKETKPHKNGFIKSKKLN